MCVGGKQALAIVLTDIAHLTFTIPEIRRAISAGGYGQTNVSKDFLKQGETDKVVKRGEKSSRRRCEAIFINAIDNNISDQLLKRKCITLLWLAFLPSIGIILYSMHC